MGENTQCCSSHKETKSEQLEKDIRLGESWLIGINGSLLLVTVVIAVIYYGQLCQMKRAVKAAEGANQVAHNTLIASNRPWLDIELKIVGPLTFDDSGAHLTVRAETTNVGHSPAVRVTDVQEFIQVIGGAPNPWKEIREQCRQAEGQSALASNRGLTQTIFIGKPQQQEWTLVMNPTELNREIFPGKKLPNVYPAIVWCVAYRTDFSEVEHHIGYAWQIWRKVPPALIDPKRGNIPANELNIFQFPFYGPLAD